ncbi:hypothetical protein [Mucilaginibacter sp.]|uniref:hypothetical protein n=1 Tax=Mucilaginibacter sp. TaxID=1882438 RepID=UPI00262A2516|nr:hypothetical protein [Mucilaginibacter sp.]MDB4923033.1 hypothetical protein [Mucilaginibacter sp.]
MERKSWIYLDGVLMKPEKADELEFESLSQAWKKLKIALKETNAYTFHDFTTFLEKDFKINVVASLEQDFQDTELEYKLNNFYTTGITKTKVVELQPSFNDIKNEAFTALEKFRETKDEDFLISFLNLIEQYKSAIACQLRELHYALAQIKSPKITSLITDFRGMLRRKIKMISMNTDDEHNSVKNSSNFISQFFNQIISSNEQQLYSGCYQRLGVLL